MGRFPSIRLGGVPLLARLSATLRGMATPDQTDDVPAEEHLPPYVKDEADRKRWDHAGTVARDVLGEDATDEAVWSMRRVIFHDRETYPD